MRLCLAIVLSWFLVFPVAATEGLRLFMIEQPGCTYCKQWDREVSQAYDASPQGSLAPLERHQLRNAPPRGVKFASRPVFTPTFILVRDGVEIGRLEGYQSADFFWSHLDRLLDVAGIPPR